MHDHTADMYDRLEADTLTNLLTDASQEADTHRRALEALAKLNPAERHRRLARVLKAVAAAPDAYDDELKLAVVEVLATDPHPDATEAMVEGLPAILAAAMASTAGLTQDFREYYYQALVTRSRDGDLEVWADMLPALDGRTLVAMLLDPAAGPLEVLEPMTLLSRLPAPEKARALTSLVVGLVRRAADRERLRAAAAMLAALEDAALVEQSAATLADQWEKAQKGERRREAAALEAVLRLVDKRPRTAGERLMGRRPWAG